MIFIRNLTFLAVFLSLTNSAHACRLTFAVSNEFPPHHVLVERQQWSGLTTELFKELAAGAGCSVQVVNVPWDRNVDLLAMGRVDAVSLFTHSEERAEFAYFIGPHYMERMVLIANKKHVEHLKTPSDILSFRGIIGKTQGTYYGSELQPILSRSDLENTFIDIINNDSRIKMLKAEHIDATFEEASVAQYLFNTGQLDQEKQIVSLKFSASPVYFSFSKPLGFCGNSKQPAG